MKEELKLINLPTPTSNLRTSRAIHHIEVMRYENLLGKSMGKLWQDGLCNINEFN